MLQIFIIRNGNQSIQVFTRQLILKANFSVAKGGQFGEEDRELNVPVDGQDFGVAADISKLIIVRTGLNFSAITAHELDFVIWGRKMGGLLIIP